MQHYQRALEIHDDNSMTDYCIARISLQLGRHEEACNRFEKITSGNGLGFGYHNTYMINIDYGWALARTGRYADALPMLAEGLRQQPQNAYAWNAKAVTQA